MAQKFNTEEFIASKLWSRERLEKVKRVTVKAVTESANMGSNGKDRNSQALVKANEPKCGPEYGSADDPAT